MKKYFEIFINFSIAIFIIVLLFFIITQGWDSRTSTIIMIISTIILLISLAIVIFYREKPIIMPINKNIPEYQKMILDDINYWFNQLLIDFGFKLNERIIKPYHIDIQYKNKRKFMNFSFSNFPTDFPDWNYKIILSHYLRRKTTTKEYSLINKETNELLNIESLKSVIKNSKQDLINLLGV